MILVSILWVGLCMWNVFFCAQLFQGPHWAWCVLWFSEANANHIALYLLYESDWAAITEYHRLCKLGGLNNRSLVSHSSGSYKSKIKALSVLVSGETSFLGLQIATFSLPLVCRERRWDKRKGREREISQEISSYKDTSPIRLGPTLMTLFNLNYLLKGSSSKYSYTGD